LKYEIDSTLAKGLGIKPEEMMPWHFQNRFFQEAPQIYEVNLDTYYKKQDLVKLSKDYFKGLNLPIDDMVARSDLFERKNKNQHAYCIDINRDKKDIRVLCNVKPNSKWMETMLHEYGHALYEKFLGDDLKWVIKTPAHIFTTEAVAMFFGRLASNPQWMVDMKVIDEAERDKILPTTSKILRLQQLVFSRWAQVMYRFEKALYENPDQDLNKLWWDLAEKYQMMKRPAGRNMPDWATKIHIATSPCYYHNYLLGELLASQMYFFLAKDAGQPENMNLSFSNDAKAGDFFRNSIFAPGAKYYWNDMIEKATGEKLTAKYFAKQFVNIGK
jgi:peptidyl-dipeptidase A